jgi:hypothetical protein
MAGGRAAHKSRIESLRYRTSGLAELRHLIGLPGDCDISVRQWAVLEPQLIAASARLNGRVKKASNAFYSAAGSAKEERRLVNALGEVELDLARAYGFFDTYMDVITQRHSRSLGPLLAGCDVLAWDAMRRDHPALRTIEPPLVFCDRGFGASIIREDVTFPDGTPNPMPLIQIPYSRLRQKCNLTSILHEAGHQALARMGLIEPIGEAFRSALRSAGRFQQDLVGQWALEIGPDFWSLCLSGIGAVATLQEILTLPPSQVYRILPSDPHPPPYLRALLGFECCRQLWGRGIWDEWEQNWRRIYPLTDAVSTTTRRLLTLLEKQVRRLADALLSTRFAALSGRRLSDLFDLSVINPERLGRIVSAAKDGVIRLSGLPAPAQLAVFRLLRERVTISEEKLDDLMSNWLVGLSRTRHNWT